MDDALLMLDRMRRQQSEQAARVEALLRELAGAISAAPPPVIPPPVVEVAAAPDFSAGLRALFGELAEGSRRTEEALGVLVERIEQVVESAGSSRAPLLTLSGKGGIPRGTHQGLLEAIRDAVGSASAWTSASAVAGTTPVEASGSSPLAGRRTAMLKNDSTTTDVLHFGPTDAVSTASALLRSGEEVDLSLTPGAEVWVRAASGSCAYTFVEVA